MIDTVLNNPSDTARRSPLYRYHQARDAEFTARSESMLVSKYPEDQALGTDQVQSLALFDLTGLARLGFKGVDTQKWLSGQQVPTPERPNQACVSDDGLTIARLSDQEFLLLAPIVGESSKLDDLKNNWSMDIDARTYLLERADSHACFALTGSLASEVLSKVCAVDMRAHKFAQFNIAQTSVARANSIVIRVDQEATLCFYILADLSTSEFMWEGLLDAMQEFGGEPMGISVLK